MSDEGDVEGVVVTLLSVVGSFWRRSVVGTISVVCVVESAELVIASTGLVMSPTDLVSI